MTIPWAGEKKERMGEDDRQRLKSHNIVPHVPAGPPVDPFAAAGEQATSDSNQDVNT